MPLHVRRDASADAPDPRPEPDVDAALLQRVRAGDAAAFETLFKTYYAALCDFTAGYVHARETAEELVQSVFLRIWIRRDTWAPSAGVRAYLFAACRNQALDHLRHQRIVDRTLAWTGGADEPPAGHGAPAPDPDTAVRATELSDALGRAVQSLPERRRSVLLLRWRHQLTNAEIAATLAISVKAVEAHVTRALVVLRDRLQPFRS